MLPPEPDMFSSSLMLLEHRVYLTKGRSKWVTIGVATSATGFHAEIKIEGEKGDKLALGKFFIIHTQ